MKITKHILLIFIFFYAITTHAQKVSNIIFSQEQSNIVISYDLETKNPCKVSLFISTNGGITWQGPLIKVSGDVGTNLQSGNKSITWNVLEEFEELRGEKIMFQVRAIDDVIDVVENHFVTTIIGNKELKFGAEWSVYNLNVSKYRNGDLIPHVSDPNEWANLKTGAWCYYNNDPENGKIYGKLYNWYAVVDPRGLAPVGFSIPSVYKIRDLGMQLQYKNVGCKLKEKGETHWLSPNTEANNSSGFTALPGGSRDENGNFGNIGEIGFWWTNTIFGHFPSTLVIRYDSCDGSDNTRNRNAGLSVRCIKDWK
jgi:uncharacterized protein (TIGR02145 family)